MSDLTPKQENFILYTTPEGEVKLNVLLENETIWLTQKSMGILFDTTPQNITTHLKNIFESGELEEEATCKEFLQVHPINSPNIPSANSFIFSGSKSAPCSRSLQN